MNADEVIEWLKMRERTAGKFARPHWRNAVREIQMAKHQEVEDRLDPQQRRGTVVPVNRAKFHANVKATD